MEANLSFADDLRQSFVVMKNEIKKHARGKRLIIFVALYMLILVVIFAAFTYGSIGTSLDSRTMAQMYLSLVSLMTIIGVTLFGATAIVSEFEERTALIIFNRPIKKGSIYVGKFLAAFLIVLLVSALYYAGVAVVVTIGPGGVGTWLLESFGYLIVYIFACLGMAFMISSFMKKSSTASILTFFMLALLLDMLFLIIVVAAGIQDTWFMLSTAADAVTGCVVGTVADPIRNIAVMISWGLVPAILGFLIFRNRDF